MSKEPTTKKVNNDEIDIFEFVNRIGATLKKWTNAIGRAILISIIFLIRRWIPLSITIIAGLVISYALKELSPEVYTSDLVLRNNTIDNEQIIAYVNRIKDVKDKSILSETLGISKETSDNIINIGAFWIIDLNRDSIPDNVDYYNSHNVHDTINVRMKDRFDIQVKIKSVQDLSKVRDGLIYYINNNPFFQEKNKIRLNQLSESIKRMDVDISRMDSLQKVKYFEETRQKATQSNGQIVFIQEQNTTQLLHKDILSLIKGKQSLETELNMYNQIVTVLNDFTIPVERTNNLSHFAVRVIPALLISVLLILIFISRREAIKKIFEKY